MTISLATIVMRSADVHPIELDEELAIASIEDGNYYTLKGSARQIWELTEVPCSVADLCTRLETKYHASSGRIEEDVIAFVNKLAKEKLIEIS